MVISIVILVEIAERVEAPSYISHDPIRINNNTEFASMAGSEGWVGDGSLGNPYIIEGYDINGNGYGYCIYIGNTTFYFEVRDCYLHEASGILKSPYFYDAGIILYYVQNGTIVNNIVSSSNSIGMYLYYSNNNSIIYNNLSNNDDGIYLYHSSNFTISNNEIMNEGIFIWGDVLEHWNSHIIDTTNSVNGKSVYYWKNQTGGIVPLGAGQVILANCTNVIVEHQNVNHGTVGILLGFSNSNIISHNNASSNNHGVYLCKSSNNTIINNTASSNYYLGLGFWSSQGNTITNNSASNNKWGIYLMFSKDNTITNNTSSYNDYGIDLLSSSSNTIYHNNFIDNTDQAIDNLNNGNKWDNGYPFGGNYWSDYSGLDNFKGPNQNIPGSDNIGDTFYPIFGGSNNDNYPLMKSYKPPENFIILKQGWNLISLPFIQIEMNLTRVLGSIDGWYDAVQWYDNSESSDSWKHHKIDKLFGNDLSELNETISFWIHITQPGETIFVYNGTQPTSNQTIQLHPGWNMVGYPSLTSYNRTTGLNNLTFDTHVDAIQWFDTPTKTWHFMGPDDYFVPGRGYWVHSKVKTTWEVPL
jgi:parallel beta-helix repeat protein